MTYNEGFLAGGECVINLFKHAIETREDYIRKFPIHDELMAKVFNSGTQDLIETLNSIQSAFNRNFKQDIQCGAV
jgi:hypothetical protein